VYGTVCCILTLSRPSRPDAFSLSASTRVSLRDIGRLTAVIRVILRHSQLLCEICGSMWAFGLIDKALECSSWRQFEVAQALGSWMKTITRYALMIPLDEVIC
jgi:hypothetical protein